MTTHKYVNNYDELRNIAPSPTSAGPHVSPPCDYVFVSDYLDPESSGIQGFFEWRPNSRANDNGGTVIKPNSLPVKSKGRWHRVFDGAISVKWFGAKGDGVTEDSTAIQAAIDAAATAGGGVVFIPPTRSFYATRKYLLGKDNVTVSGAGYGSFIKNVFAPNDSSKIYDAPDPRQLVP